MAKDPISADEAAWHGTFSLADTRLARPGFMSAEEREVLARVPLTVRSVRAGDELIREQSTPENLYFLAAGWACRYNLMRNGKRQITVLLTPGGVCNLDNLMFERADFAVRALTEAKVLALPRDRALSLAAEYPSVGRAFTWLALAQNAILSQWAVGLGRRGALQRLAHFICEMSVRLGGDRSFEMPLTQELIADTIGLTAVHINRTMGTLRSQGLIALAGRRLTILNGDRLRILAEFDQGYLDQIETSAASAVTV